MKTGRTLTQLACEIERQRQNRQDFVSSTKTTPMILNAEAADIAVEVPGHGAFELKDLAHRQVGDHVQIPAKYYDRMREKAPGLLVTNVNHWFDEQPQPRMLRVLDGRLRAFLSDRFRPLENFDLAEAALPALIEQDLDVISCEITDRRLYIKAVDKRIQRDIPTGRKMGDGTHTFFDTVSPGIVISNSEVGAGALSVETAVWTRACTNLAIFAQRSLRKYHLGGKHEMGEEIVSLLSEKTKRLSDAATWAQVGDVVRGAFDRAKFDASIDEVQGLVEQKIEGDVVKVIDLAARSLNIGELEKPSVLRHLIEGGDLSRYGLFNAITRTAEDLPDYDRATDFERMGGQLIELGRDQWKQIAEAA